MNVKAAITHNGAVTLGSYVACDSSDKFKPLRVVTHAHADHMIGLRRSLKTCEKVLMTPMTKDLIDVLRGPLFLMGGFVKTLNYGETMRYKDESVTFFKADHMLGACQVLVEDAEGTRIVFTGDFRLDKTPVLNSDVLVMEATYGSPHCRRSFGVNVKDLLVSLVEKGLKKGVVHVFGYHGKLQEVMQILHDANVRVPFVVPERVYQVSKVCEKHGMRLGRLTLSREREGRELLEHNTSCVAFHHMNSKNKAGLRGFRIYVSGWEFNTACREIRENEYIIALSDHSDFKGLMEYVRRSKPKLVITDNFRVGYANVLAGEIRRKFGIKAVALPKK